MSKIECPIVDEIVKNNINDILGKISNELSELTIDTMAEDTAFSKGKRQGLQSALYIVAKWKEKNGNGNNNN